MDGNQYFGIDAYPFWTDQAIMEIKRFNPYYIDRECYSDYPDAGLRYFNNDANNKCVTFGVNLETNTITRVTLEGYAD